MPVLERVRFQRDPGSSTFAARFGSLSGRELRILVLAAEGQLSSAQLSEALGVSRAAIGNAMARIRRKLAVPTNQSLQAFVKSVPEIEELIAGVELSDLPPNPPERRTRDVLRVTVAELDALVSRVRTRAAALDELVWVGDTIAEEAQKLAVIDGVLAAALEHVLTVARSSPDSCDRAETVALIDRVPQLDG